MSRNKPQTRQIRYLMRRPALFSFQTGSIKLRPYQEQAIQAVIDSVVYERGMEFTWIFPRQSGKDESLAVLVQYLLTRSMIEGAEMVFFNPTFKPQTETSMRRLEARLQSNVLTKGKWKRKSGYIYQMRNAFCTYLSGDPTANTVGATANLLLIVNEAQDISTFKYDKDIEPTVASANATRLFSGTRWTTDTLLEREYQRSLEEEKRDGMQRVFFFTAEDVRKYVPAYGAFVDGVVRRLGRKHPLVKTQYFCETIDAQAGMFPPGRQAMMKGTHTARTAPEAGKIYAFLIDVAGQDESQGQGLEQGIRGKGIREAREQGRDSTLLKIVEVDRSTVEALGKPTYLTVFRKEWTGEKHVKVFGTLQGLVKVWKPARIVIDATGVGEGMWSWLDNAFGPDMVRPLKFTAKLKSELGYGFIEMIDSGRTREYEPFPEALRVQMNKCRSEIVPGPAKLMRWGVPDGTRDQASGELVHDDDLMTGAMCHILDGEDWRLSTGAVWTTPKDPLEGMDRAY
ncbi:MAG: hypothetical protein ABSA23_12195 [Anaerolineales bacterium]|jgi:hypothetical protein